MKILNSPRGIILVLACLTLMPSGALARQSPTPATGAALTNADVQKMVEAKLADPIIIAKIHASTCNFDTSTDALLKLKAAGISDAVIEAMVEATGANRSDPTAKPAEPDPNDPKSPHDAGIYWRPKEKRDKQMVALEPSVYSQGKSGGMFTSAMTYGIAKAKWKAVVRGDRSNLRTSESTPEFWFYFEEKSHGLSQSAGYFTAASSPNEFILAKMEQKDKDRELIVSEFGAFRASAGTRSKDVMDFDFEKVAPGVYKVTPKSPLKPGEYCFFYAGTNMGMGMTGGKLFDFGIDPPR